MITSLRELPVTSSTLRPGLSASSTRTTLLAVPAEFDVVMSHSGKPPVGVVSMSADVEAVLLPWLLSGGVEPTVAELSI